MIWLVALLTLTGCDKLEDSDVINETLPGTWAFSYKASEQLDFEMSFQCVIFREDGTCSLTYPDGQENGTYRASNAAIKIDAVVDGEQQTYLWRVLVMSPNRVVAEYTHQAQGRDVTLTVTLDKLTDTVSERVGTADDEAAGVGSGQRRHRLVSIGQHLFLVGLDDVLHKGVGSPVVELLHGAQRPIDV